MHRRSFLSLLGAAPAVAATAASASFAAEAAAVPAFLVARGGGPDSITLRLTHSREAVRKIVDDYRDRYLEIKLNERNAAIQAVAYPKPGQWR